MFTRTQRTIGAHELTGNAFMSVDHHDGGDEQREHEVCEGGGAAQVIGREVLVA